MPRYCSCGFAIRRCPVVAGHDGVAADDPDEGHDVGTRHVGRERHEIALTLDDPIGQSTALGLASGDRDERRGRIDRHGRRCAGGQELELDGPNAAADVEQGRGLDVLCPDGLDEESRRPVRPVCQVAEKTF